MLRLEDLGYLLEPGHQRNVLARPIEERRQELANKSKTCWLHKVGLLARNEMHTETWRALPSSHFPLELFPPPFLLTFTQPSKRLGHGQYPSRGDWPTQRVYTQTCSVTFDQQVPDKRKNQSGSIAGAMTPFISLVTSRLLFCYVYSLE